VNTTVVNAPGSVRFHASGLELEAFLSESSNRVTMIGRYLKHRSEAMFSEAKRYPGVRDVSTVAR